MKLTGNLPAYPKFRERPDLYRMIFEPAANTVFFRAGNAEAVRALHWLRSDLRMRRVPLMGNIEALSPQSSPDLTHLETGCVTPGRRTLVDLKNHPGYLAPMMTRGSWNLDHNQGSIDRLIFEAGCSTPRVCMEIYKAFLIYALVWLDLMSAADYPEYENCFELLGNSFIKEYNS
jgi:hypothetical protein